MKLQEILKLKPTSNKYFELRKTVYNKGETEPREVENSPDRGSEDNLIKEILIASAQELNNKTLDVFFSFLDNILKILSSHWNQILIRNSELFYGNV